MKNSCFTVANLILCWLIVNILLPDNKLKSGCHNSGHPKVRSLHIWNLISKRFKRFARPFWRAKIFCEVKHLYRLSFQRLAPIGVTIDFTVQIWTVRYYLKFSPILGRCYFTSKRKILNLAMGLNPTPVRGWVFHRSV